LLSVIEITLNNASINGRLATHFTTVMTVLFKDCMGRLNLVFDSVNITICKCRERELNPRP
jgi:hypothetical protein